MKNIHLVAALCAFFTAFGLEAQECGLPLSSIDIQANNIKARVLNGGDLFTDLNTGQFIPNPSGSNSPTTIFSAGLWMGGASPSGELNMATVDYRGADKGDYAAGPLDENGENQSSNCTNWDRHFSVTAAQVASFKAALPLSEAQAIALFPSIMGWPGVGNPYFSNLLGFQLPANSPGLAPYFDKDGDGLYNPLNGDYPAVLLRGQAPFVPTEIIWCVFNDQKGGAAHTASGGRAFKAEIQLTVWAIQSNSNTALNNTVFTSHKILNRGTEVTSGTYLGLWVDFDLGCYLDDHVGSNPALNSFFAYNQDNVDGQPGTSCIGIPTFQGTPPVQSVTFLGQSMDKFMYMSGITPDLAYPSNSNEIYNFMRGYWTNGTSLTEGGSGYGGTTPTNFAFPDDPSDPNGWSMCTANLIFGDQRVLATHNVGDLAPGQVEEFNAAWTTHFITESPCSVGNTFDDIETIIDIYEDGFSTLSKVADVALLSFELMPNPSSQQVVCRYGDVKVQEIRIFNASGKLVSSEQNPALTQTTLDVSRLPVGIYSVQIISKEGVGVQKISVMR